MEIPSYLGSEQEEERGQEHELQDKRQNRSLCPINYCHMLC
jgi:hypothetical protein